MSESSRDMTYSYASQSQPQHVYAPITSRVPSASDSGLMNAESHPITGSVTSSGSMIPPPPWSSQTRSPPQQLSLSKPPRTASSQVGNPQAIADGPVPVDIGKRICPFAAYNPQKFNGNDWPQCHHLQEKNGDIVVHLQRHHRLIRSQRKADKNGRKNGNGQSYIAICSGENFNERGDSQCHQCDSFESLVEMGPKPAGPWDKSPHHISAICQKCWCILSSREELISHLRLTCGGRAPKHIEKWDLELQAFCRIPGWILPGTSELMPTGSLSTVLSAAMAIGHGQGAAHRSDSELTMPPNPHMDHQASLAYGNHLYAEIDKLRIHLWLLACHPTAPVTNQVRNWYLSTSDTYGMSPPNIRDNDARLSAPSITWPFQFGHPTMNSAPPPQPPPPASYMSVPTMSSSESSGHYMTAHLPPPH